MSAIEFNPETHTYTIDGVVVISVTQLLQKYGISRFNTSYTNAVIEAAKKNGTFFHREAEMVQKGLLEIDDMLSAEASQFAEWYCSLPSRPLYAEKLCHYGTVYAGTCDMIYQDENGKMVLVDYKTGAFHEKEHSWQLTLYKKALAEEGIKIDRMEIWCFKDSTVHRVEEIPAKDVEELLAKEMSGEPLNESKELDSATNDELIQLTDMLRSAREFELAIKKATEGIDECKQKILDYMIANGIESAENELIKLTAVKPSTRKSVDSEALQKDHPEIYQDYLKETTVKASLRITWRDEE